MTEINIGELRIAVQRARGWYGRICSDTGVKRTVLRRLGNDPAYDPPLSVAKAVNRWFMLHGIPAHHPLSKAAQAAPVPTPPIGSRAPELE